MESIHMVWGVHDHADSNCGLLGYDAMSQNCHDPYTLDVIQFICNRTMVLYASNHTLLAKCNIL